MCVFFFFQAEDGIRDRSPSRGLGDVYKRQGQLQPPQGRNGLFHMDHFLLQKWNLLVDGHGTGSTDQVRSVRAGGKVEECLRLLGQGSGIVGDEDERALDLVGAVLDGILTALHALHGDSLDGIADGRQGSVADGQGVGLHSADDSAGGRQLLGILCLLYTSPSPRDGLLSRMPSSA